MFAPEQLRDAELRELYDYWLAKHHDGQLPRRSDIDPLEIPRLLQSIALLEVVGDAKDFVFALAGSRIEQALDRTLKGVSLGDLRKVLERSQSAEQYIAAVRSHAPQYRESDLKEYGKEHWNYRRLILPLSSDGEQVDCVLVGALFNSAGEPGHQTWLEA